MFGKFDNSPARLEPRRVRDFGRRPGFGGWPTSVVDAGEGGGAGIPRDRLVAVATRKTAPLVDLKGGRWTKDWCGGVQEGRMCLSGLMWVKHRRSGWFRPPPHWIRSEA